MKPILSSRPSKYHLSLKLVLSFVWIAASFSASAQTTTAVIPGDFPDPTIIHTPNGYYAAATSSEWAPHFPIYHSTDLLEWKQEGYVFEKAPEWTVGSFWAPEYYHIGTTYYIYYTARRKSDNISCIGVATSKYPDHGFIDHGVIVSHGREAIDPFVFNDNGQLYIVFKAYGLDNRPIELLTSKLSSDGLKAEDSTLSLLIDDKKTGMEGESILKHGKYYYLFYSAGGCCGLGCSYHVQVARATAFAGPYEKYEGGAVLEPAPGWKCSGHGTFVQTPEGKYYFLCHAYNQTGEVFTGRQGVLASLIWPTNDEEWPVMHASTARHTLPDIHESFTSSSPALDWQYDFHNALPVVKQKEGSLFLSGTMLNDNQAGIVYGMRPLSDNFDMTVTVSNYSQSLKGLAFYGTAQANIGVGVAGSTVKFWVIKDGKFRVIDSAGITSSVVVQLKLSMTPDRVCKAYYKQGKTDWKELAANESHAVNFLPQWDRPHRIGLFYNGPFTESAKFTRFSLDNKKE